MTKTEAEDLAIAMYYVSRVIEHENRNAEPPDEKACDAFFEDAVCVGQDFAKLYDKAVGEDK